MLTPRLRVTIGEYMYNVYLSTLRLVASLAWKFLWKMTNCFQLKSNKCLRLYAHARSRAYLVGFKLENIYSLGRLEIACGWRGEERGRINPIIKE